MIIFIMKISWLCYHKMSCIVHLYSTKLIDPYIECSRMLVASTFLHQRFPPAGGLTYLLCYKLN